MPKISFKEAQQQTEKFLTEEMRDALKAVDYTPQSFELTPQPVKLSDVARAEVELRHVQGAPECVYLIEAFDDDLLMQLQINVWRLVVVYRIPALHGLDSLALQPRLNRWQLGAEHAGWTIGWRDAASPHNRENRYVETYCYAMADRGFLTDEMERLYWRTDIVQMTRYFMLEAQRCGVKLSPRRAGHAM